jgi:hypothetical protein
LSGSGQSVPVVATRAAASIDSGAALDKLNRFIEFTNR